MDWPTICQDQRVALLNNVEKHNTESGSGHRQFAVNIQGAWA
jgi:hypothetical protein